MGSEIFEDGGFDCKVDVCAFIVLTGLDPFPKARNSLSSGAGSPAIADSVGRLCAELISGGWVIAQVVRDDKLSSGLACPERMVNIAGTGTRSRRTAPRPSASTSSRPMLSNSRGGGMIDLQSQLTRIKSEAFSHVSLKSISSISFRSGS
jgi:hypothetical protein